MTCRPRREVRPCAGACIEQASVAEARGKGQGGCGLADGVRAAARAIDGVVAQTFTVLPTGYSELSMASAAINPAARVP